MNVASDSRDFGARDAHSSLPDQPGRLNLELQAMNVLLPSRIIGFPHLVDRSLSSLDSTGTSTMIGSSSETRAGGPNHGLHPLPSRPPKRTTTCWSCGLFLGSDRLAVLHAATLLSWRKEPVLPIHTPQELSLQSYSFPLSPSPLSLSLPPLSYPPSSFPSPSPLGRVLC
ncbi:hypothetical protein BDV28DRAFT_144254 [Aspergillus coremiiformis]|uniref:Uncharacterized protein n=1 Tax=Aspergillus coremiiformis TaxID=138285 RepID=A0A5N6YWV0_9EURO|nr:hypothetical protein BDV28DRAFT_144254 [Aspergillus coremiiformis]